MRKPTRFYSNRQEKKVAKTVRGRKTSNSGATKFSKGDVYTDDFLIECKTVTTEQQSFTIKKEWIDKLEEEKFAMNKSHSALVFDFGDGIQHYVINEKLFKYLVEYIHNAVL